MDESTPVEKDFKFLFTFRYYLFVMSQNDTTYKLTEERKAIISEALRVRAEARKSLGPELLNKLYYILTGQFPDEDDPKGKAH